jgi:hypothetical protein
MLGELVVLRIKLEINVKMKIVKGHVNVRAWKIIAITIILDHVFNHT